MTDSLRIPVGPGALHVARFGFGDRAVVFVHGFGTSSFVWRAVAPALPLGQVTAYAVDLFGHGESDRAAEADYGITAQAAYLDQALTVLRVSSADVVALDVGCAVALALAARRPARVRSLVLINPVNPAAPRADDLALLQRLAARHLFDASRGQMGARLLLAPLLEKGVANAAQMPEALVLRYLAPFVGRDGTRQLLAIARAVNDRALTGVEWERVSAPTWVIRGERDPWVPEAVSAQLAARLPEGTLRRISRASRLVPEDAPEELAALLVEWVTQRQEDAV